MVRVEVWETKDILFRKSLRFQNNIKFYYVDTTIYDESVNTAHDIETRAMNFPLEDCYTWQDIEMIIFGEIQE